MSSRLRAIARETVEIAERGTYPAGGGEVAIGEYVKRAVTGTRLYAPEDALPEFAGPARATGVEVTGETSLQATRRLGGDPACLVFASARHPGGGFLNGAQAQEESLARSSALYKCQLEAGGFYRAHTDLVYSDRVIYSPAVPVFRDDNGDLLSEPYPVSFLTAAAPNRTAIAGNQPEHLVGLPEVLARRARRVLAVAAAHGHRRLVLGAWGCGVFGNQPAMVASAFASALRVSPWFDFVTFAVLDREPGTPTLAAFRNALSG